MNHDPQPSDSPVTALTHHETPTRAWTPSLIRHRPVLAAIGLLAALALVLSSCRSSPSFSDVPGRDLNLAKSMGEPTMRIRIAKGLTDLKISGPPMVQIALGAGDGRQWPLPLGIRASESTIRLTAAGQGPLTLAAGENLDLVPIGGERLQVNGATYPGTLRIVARRSPPTSAASASLTLDVIELLPIEEYLVGVLPRELFPDWPLEAYRVQAICARTYALHERERSLALGEDYDVEATTQDQAYGPTLQHQHAQTAVQESRGIVLTWQGQLIRAYYSSTCGGRPSSASKVWRTDKGYEFNLAAPLQGRPREHSCTPATYYRWNTERELPHLIAQLKRWGEANEHPIAALQGLRSVRATGWNAADRPVQYTLIDDTGRPITMSGEEFRLACNVDLPGQPKVTGTTRVRSGDVEVELDARTVSIQGRGFGHGVGMCQWCTKEFVTQGRHWRELLAMFYPGAKLERAY
jgi:stage II sporulation protein D